MPITMRLEITGLGATLFCHGSPRSDEEILTAITPPKRLDPMLDGVREEVIVCGHTHIQFDRRLGDRRLVNAGSVGMPWEGEAGLACWALLGPDGLVRDGGPMVVAGALGLYALIRSPSGHPASAGRK